VAQWRQQSKAAAAVAVLDVPVRLGVMPARRENRCRSQPT
jgi:hypothetical protein